MKRRWGDLNCSDLWWVEFLYKKNNIFFKISSGPFKHQTWGWVIRTNLILSTLNIKEMQGSCSNIQLSINLTFNIDVEMFICAKWIFHNFRHFDPGIQKNVHNKLVNVAQHVLEKDNKNGWNLKSNQALLNYRKKVFLFSPIYLPKTFYPWQNWKSKKLRPPSIQLLILIKQKELFDFRLFH